MSNARSAHMRGPMCASPTCQSLSPKSEYPQCILVSGKASEIFGRPAVPTFSVIDPALRSLIRGGALDQSRA